MSQSTVVSRRGVVPFNVTFEATGFTDADLCNRQFAGEEARGFSKVAMTEGQFPPGILSVVRGWISEGDAQKPTDRKVFICVTLRVCAASVDNASRTAPPAVLLTRIVDAMASTETGECLVSLEGNWKVAEVVPFGELADGQAGEDPAETVLQGRPDGELPEKRILAVFLPQAWVNDYATYIDGQQAVDVTQVVLQMDLRKIHALRDYSDSTDALIDTVALGHNGPFTVRAKDSICDFFEAKDLSDITESMLLAARKAALKVPETTPPLWDRDDIQFPRLLAEILATQENLDMSALAESMDLSVEEVSSLFDRADKAWETIKAEACPVQSSLEGEPSPTDVRKAVLQFVVLHDDGADLSSWSLEELARLCDDGGYLGGGLSIVSSTPLTRAQLGIEAAKLGSEAAFFIDPDDESLGQISSSRL